MIADVLASYRLALGRLVPFLAAHLFIRLVVASLIVPLVGLALAATLAFSDQTALTDQDIARFLATPAGLVGAVVILSLLVVALVLDVVVATAILRQDQRGPLAVLRVAADFLLHAVPRLLPFVAHFLLRVALIVLPFVVAAGAVAYALLTEFDINYYLTERPPAFRTAAALIGVILATLAVILLRVLSSWAIAMHIVLFEGETTRRAFAESEGHMIGHRRGLVLRLILWAFARAALAAVAGGFSALIISVIAGDRAQDLTTLAFAMLVGSALYVGIMAGVNALSNGALAALLNAQFDRALAGEVPDFDLRRFHATPQSRARRPRLLIGLVVAVSLATLGTGGALSERLANTPDAQIIAHRGAAATAPENTMASVLHAIEAGADWIEIDVQETADGVVIVAHDSDFMKAARVPTKVWEITSGELAAVDVGSWFDAGFASERVPTLREVLEAARGQANVLIELKYYGHDEDLEQRVAAIVEAVGTENEIATMSLKYPAVQKMRALRPDWPAGVLAATSVGDLAGLDGDFLALNQSRITAGLVRRADAAGKAVYAWTVNDPLSMTRMLWLGVDGLITDDPVLARDVLDQYAALSVLERFILALADRASHVVRREDIAELRP